MLEIALISNNNELYRLLLGVLSELPTSDWTLVKSEGRGPGRADLRVWDYRPDMLLPARDDGFALSDIFLVHRADLDSFHQMIGHSGAMIVLQPVCRASLASPLKLALKTYLDGKDKSGRTQTSLLAERDELLQCLMQANLRLQEYDQDRTNFLARAMHDFRAPLTALNGYCALMLSEPWGELNSNQKQVLERMQYSTKRLSRMVNGMFDMSVDRKIQRPANLQRADIRDSIDQAVHELGSLGNHKNIAISVELQPQQSSLYFQPDRIEQVLINVLDNAIKFTPRNGDIEIRGYSCFWDRREPRGRVAFSVERRTHVSSTCNAYRVDIRNSGSPIPAEQLKTIFEEYASYGGSCDRAGAGLGLAICATILRQHHGKIWAENTEAGPLFSFVLPLQNGAH